MAANLGLLIAQEEIDMADPDTKKKLPEVDASNSSQSEALAVRRLDSPDKNMTDPGVNVKIFDEASGALIKPKDGTNVTVCASVDNKVETWSGTIGPHGRILLSKYSEGKVELPASGSATLNIGESSEGCPKRFYKPVAFSLHKESAEGCALFVPSSLVTQTCTLRVVTQDATSPDLITDSKIFAENVRVNVTVFANSSVSDAGGGGKFTTKNFSGKTKLNKFEVDVPMHTVCRIEAMMDGYRSENAVSYRQICCDLHQEVQVSLKRCVPERRILFLDPCGNPWKNGQAVVGTKILQADHEGFAKLQDIHAINESHRIEWQDFSFYPDSISGSEAVSVVTVKPKVGARISPSRRSPEPSPELHHELRFDGPLPSGVKIGAYSASDGEYLGEVPCDESTGTFKHQLRYPNEPVLFKVLKDGTEIDRVLLGEKG
jgi:hypothetical protein